MKNFIKPFQTFVNENRESGYYPAGTEFDPSAPWNQTDPDVERENDWIDGRGAKDRVKFSLVEADYREFAILKHLENGELYIAYLAGDEIEEYMPKAKQYVGRDEDGDADYEYEDLEMDDAAIIAMASDYESEAGNGMESWDNAEVLVKIDDELRRMLIDDFTKWSAKDRSYAKMVAALGGDAVNEAEIRDRNIKNKLERIHELKTRIKELTEETKQINSELKEFDTDIKPIFDAMKVLNDRLATTERYAIKITRFGGPADNPSYAKAIEQALEQVDDAAKAIINECVRLNTGVKNNTHQYDIEKIDESLSDKAKAVIEKVKVKIGSLVDRFKKFFSSKIDKIDAANQKLEKMLTAK
jgi:hypothetical protein